MPSFAISKFTVLLEPLWVSAEFLLLSTDPNLDSTCRTASVHISTRQLIIIIMTHMYTAEVCSGFS